MKKQRYRGGITVLFCVVIIFFRFPGNQFAGDVFKIDIHGYISQGFLMSNRNNFLAKTESGSFQFNELGINFSTDVSNKIRAGIQFAARDLGDTGNDRILIDWAYADFHWQDWLGLRVGKVKIPFGFYNKTRDIDMLRTFVFLPQSVYPENYREASTAMKGAGIYGNAALNTLGTISYQFLAGESDIPRHSSIAKGAEAMGGIEVEKFDIRELYCAGLTWNTPLDGLRLGVTAMHAKMTVYARLTEDFTIPVDFPPFTITLASRGDSFIGNFPYNRIFNYSAEYTWNNLILAAEYQVMDQKMLITMGSLPPYELITKSEGYYGSITYRFSGWFEMGGYYSVFYADRRDRTGINFDPPFSAYQKDACICFRFDLDSQWTFKLEGHLMDGVALCFPQDNTTPAGDIQYDGTWALLALKMTYLF